MTVSVPPSAARAAKLSAARAAKRAARSAPPAVNDSVQSWKPSFSRLLQQQQPDDDTTLSVKRQQRWYMGEYGDADGKTMPCTGYTA